MNTAFVEKSGIEFCQVNSPVNLPTAWQIESLLLKIFEYGDYSFRSALCGRYCKELNCTFFISRKNTSVIGAAGCLYSRKNPLICILGPVCVESAFRRKGLASELCKLLLSYLKAEGCLAVYLGVGQHNPAVALYKKLGFEKYKGIVMRKLFCSESLFAEKFSEFKEIKLRRTDWSDFPSVSALICEPANLYTFDYQRKIFSSKFVKPHRFLSVFPEMIKSFEKYGGFANVLIAGNEEALVGIAHINRLSSPTQCHIAILDFFVRDNFIGQSSNLVAKTIQQSFFLSTKKIIAYCIACDHNKQNVLQSLGAKKLTVLPQHIYLDNKFIDVLIYEL